MRGPSGKYFALAVLVSLALPGFVPGTFATTIDTGSAPGTSVNVNANISFEQAIIAIGKEPDITFGDIQATPNRKVTLDAAGNMNLEGKNGALAPYGRPGVITIGDSRGEILNFVSDNYHAGRGMSSLHARCALKGAEDAPCDTRPVTGKLENTVFIGMDMTVEDGITPVDNKAVPSFDMSIIYQ